MTNFLNKPLLSSLLSFMQTQDPNGEWSEAIDNLDDITKQDVTYILEVLTNWINDGLEVTPRIQEYINYLNELLEGDNK
jgi:hypothetical protein